MYILLSVATIIVSLILVLVVLVQNSKGGGLSSNFSSSNQIMGAPKTADFLEKVTWGLAGVVMILSLVSAKIVHNANQQQSVNQVMAPVNTGDTPNVDSPQPQQQGSEIPQLPEAPTE